MNKNLLIIRGVSGAGKSTLGHLIADIVIEADQFFYDEEGNYKFNGQLLPKAHEDCRVRTELAMCKGIKKIAVCNTFTQEWEMKPYFVLAERHGYSVTTIIVENRNNTKNIHNVPEEALQKMKSRFEVKL